MNILHINGYFKADMAYQENLLILGQKEAGHNVFLITSRYEPDFKINTKTRKKSIGSTEYKGTTIIRVDDYGEIKKNALVLLKNIVPNINKIRPDIILVHDVSPNLFYALYYKIKNPAVKLQIDFHSTDDNARSSRIGPAYHFFWKVFFSLFGSYFDKFFPVAPECKIFANKYYNIPLNKLILVPLPGDMVLYNSRKTIRASIRKELGIPEECKVVIHTGKLPEDKETLLVLNAFSSLESSNFRLLIAGSIDKEFASTFNTYLEKDSRIINLGWLGTRELSRAYCASDVLLQPGSLSNSFIDAICCGLPVILSRTETGKMLTSFNNGLLIDILTVKEVCKAILILINDSNRIKNEANYKQAAKYFHYKNIAQLTLNKGV